MRKLYGHRTSSARNIAVGQKIHEIRAKNPGISPQQAMSMASKAVANGRGCTWHHTEWVIKNILEVIRRYTNDVAERRKSMKRSKVIKKSFFER